MKIYKHLKKVLPEKVLQSYLFVKHKQAYVHKQEKELIQKTIQKDDVCVDVGANIGYFTNLFLRLAPKGKVFAFEPCKKTFYVMVKHITAKERVLPFNIGISDKKGGALLYISESHPQNAMYEQDNTVGTQLTYFLPLDYFLTGKHVDFIKMDIQGAELKALKGAERVLQQNKNIKLLLEFSPYCLVRCSGLNAPTELISFLITHGFRIKDVKTGRTVNTGADLHEYDFRNKKYTNLYCWR